MKVPQPFKICNTGEEQDSSGYKWEQKGDNYTLSENRKKIICPEMFIEEKSLDESNKRDQ